MCSLIVVGSEEYKKAKRVKVLLQRYKIKNTLIFCLISIQLSIKEKEFKVNRIKLEPKTLLKLICLFF